MDLTELVRKVRKGDKSELDQFRRLLAVEKDLGAFKEFADAHWQEDEISIPIYERFLEINPIGLSALSIKSASCVKIKAQFAPDFPTIRDLRLIKVTTIGLRLAAHQKSRSLQQHLGW